MYNMLYKLYIFSAYPQIVEYALNLIFKKQDTFMKNKNN